MLNNFRNIQSLFWSHGSRWLLFRLGYFLRKRTGLLRWQLPVYEWQDRPLSVWLKRGVPSYPKAYAEWRKQNSPGFFFGSRAERSRSDSAVAGRVPEDVPWDSRTAVNEAEKIISGEIKFFSHTYYPVGFPPDWHRDPVTGAELDAQKHWSELSNDADVDIKYIWEPSRFGMVFPLVRAYASTRDDRVAEAFWDLIHAWEESNPPNAGPNWMDGQEAALRLLAWTFGFYAFLDSPSTTPERISQFVVMVAAHAERIDRHVGYAISTHSNHIISEAAGLWTAGLLFPELQEAGKYLSRGRDLLEREAAAQIFPDGTYSMHSLNYHRFVLQIYLFVIRLAELNQSPLSNLIHTRVEASIDFLSHLVDPITGQMPVYGSNDGALVLPLNNCDFTDYRPLLQLGSYATRKKFVFEPGPWDEDVYWFYGEQALIPSLSPEERRTLFPSPPGRGERGEGATSFPHGGIHLLRGPHSQAVIRCTDYRSRPSHADQLHVDLWMRGQNIACDAGTYLYSGEGIWRNGLARTAVHNTVTVDALDQMKMLTRFTWTEWSKGEVLHQDQKTWQGAHDGYRRLADPVSHKRTVMSLGADRWLVVDQLTASQPHHYALQWLLCNGEYEVQELASAFGLWIKPSESKPSDSKIHIQMGMPDGNGTFSIVRADPNSTRGWRSQYYGHKEPAISILLEAKQTNLIFWTFFGFENDALTTDGNVLKVQAGDLQTAIDLYTPEQGMGSSSWE